jgi:hypothetical protein
VSIWFRPALERPPHQRAERLPLTAIAAATTHRPDLDPDGRSFAFQLSIDGPTEGEGAGLLIFDLDRFDGTAAAR